MAMAPATLDMVDTDRTLVLRGVSWSFYERFLDEIEGKNRTRHAYDEGDLELMPALQYFHENQKKLIARMIETLIEEHGLPMASAGSLTLKRKRMRKGVEPDECYYIQNAHRVRGKTCIRMESDPPPDLVLEVDDTHSSLDRMGIYAALGVPEVWRFIPDGLRIYVLEDGEYGEAERSPHFPRVHIHDLNRFLRQAPGMDESAWIREFRDRVRDAVTRSRD
jgi:Uma2 family endonuclease